MPGVIARQSGNRQNGATLLETGEERYADGTITSVDSKPLEEDGQGGNNGTSQPPREVRRK